MCRTLLEANQLYKSFDGVKAVAGFSCSVHQGEVLGIIGPNGAGKTTLFNIITGFIVPDSGKIVFKGLDLTRLPPYKIATVGISRTFQNLRLIRQLSVIDNVLICFGNQLGERLSNVFFRWNASAKIEQKNRELALSLLEQGGLVDKANNLAEGLSYGQQKLLNLLCCLAADANLLLLDEPVAGIAPEMIEKILSIIRELRDHGKSVILIEHNLEAIMQISDRVIFMDAGEKLSEGSPQEVRDDPKVIDAYLD